MRFVIIQSTGHQAPIECANKFIGIPQGVACDCVCETTLVFACNKLNKSNPSAIFKGKFLQRFSVSISSAFP